MQSMITTAGCATVLMLYPVAVYLKSQAPPERVLSREDAIQLAGISEAKALEFAPDSPILTTNVAERGSAMMHDFLWPQGLQTQLFILVYFLSEILQDISAQVCFHHTIIGAIDRFVTREEMKGAKDVDTSVIAPMLLEYVTFSKYINGGFFQEKVTRQTLKAWYVFSIGTPTMILLFGSIAQLEGVGPFAK